MKIIAISRNDNGVSIMTVSDDGADIDTLIQQWQSVSGFTSVSWSQITVDDLPGLESRKISLIDRTFRDALTVQDGKILHDLTKCKTIAHDKRRILRTKELAPLDIEATIPTKATQAEAARQIIRDKYAEIQSSIDSAVDVSTLQSLLQR